MANTCTLVQVLAIRTGAILDLLSRAGYRAKEMPSFCSYFAIGHHTETLGKKCQLESDTRRGALAAVITNFVRTVPRVMRANCFEFHKAINGAAQ